MTPEPATRHCRSSSGFPWTRSRPTARSSATCPVTATTGSSSARSLNSRKTSACSWWPRVSKTPESWRGGRGSARQEIRHSAMSGAPDARQDTPTPAASPANDVAPAQENCLARSPSMRGWSGFSAMLRKKTPSSAKVASGRCPRHRRLRRQHRVPRHQIRRKRHVEPLPDTADHDPLQLSCAGGLHQVRSSYGSVERFDVTSTSASAPGTRRPAWVPHAGERVPPGFAVTMSHRSRVLSWRPSERWLCRSMSPG